MLYANDCDDCAHDYDWTFPYVLGPLPQQLDKCSLYRGENYMSQLILDREVTSNILAMNLKHPVLYDHTVYTCLLCSDCKYSDINTEYRHTDLSSHQQHCPCLATFHMPRGQHKTSQLSKPNLTQDQLRTPTPTDD